MALSDEEKEQLETELAILNSQINKTYKAQEYATSGGNSVKRPELSALLKRRAQIKKMLAGKRIQEII